MKIAEIGSGHSMRLITKVEFMEVPRDDYWEIMHTEGGPLRRANNTGANMSMTQPACKIEIVEGTRFFDSLGMEQVIGVTQESQKALGLLYTLVDESQRVAEAQEQRILHEKWKYNAIQSAMKLYVNRPVSDKFWDLIDSIIDKLTINMKEELL